MMTGAQLIAEFEQHLLSEQGRSRLTVEAYMRDLRQYADYITGGRPDTFDPKSISTADIRVWLADLARQKLQQTSVKRKLQSLRAFFCYAARRREIEADPSAPIVMSVRRRNLPVYVPAREMERLLDTNQADDFESLRDHLIITLLYTAGLRRAELLSLRDSDFRFERREITVTGKGDKQRVLPLAPDVLALARRYMELRAAEFPDLPPKHTFFVHRGRKMGETKLRAIVTAALASTSAEKRSPHVLRHTFATAMLNSGANIETVREFLGHSSLSTTQIYTHVSIAEMQREYRRAHPRAPGGAPDAERKPPFSKK